MNRKLKYTDTEFGITIIEGWLEREGMACSYLVEQDGQAALVDTGTAWVAPLILELLDEKGIDRESVKYVIPTHVHLDHAGGAGQLMAALPNATLVIHPFGARHMIDPSKLQAGATAVYGEDRFRESYDTLLPIPEQRVVEMTDGMVLDLNGRKLEIYDTPGHAKHHLAVWDPVAQGFFTGDVFGNAYPELSVGERRYITPVTSPVQLEPEKWHASIRKLLSHNPRRMFLTHYGQLENPAQYEQQLHEDLDAYVEMVSSMPAEGRYEKLHGMIRDYHRKRVHQHGSDATDELIDYIIGSDNELCAQGLDIWQLRQEKDAASA
jgi:glyoxylase-like metal-dependent hydrolase (beta-lactamase superfamily II)